MSASEVCIAALWLVPLINCDPLRDPHDGDDYIGMGDGGGGVPRKASALHAVVGSDEAAREASPSRPRPRATVDDSDGEGGKWGVQRRSAGAFRLPNLSVCILSATIGKISLASRTFLGSRLIWRPGSFTMFMDKWTIRAGCLRLLSF